MNLNEFKSWVKADAEKFRPIGDKVHEYKDEEDPTRKFIITKVVSLVPFWEGVTWEVWRVSLDVLLTHLCPWVLQGTLDTPGLKAYHERFQTFAIFEIDAARFLDDDPRWEFYYLYGPSCFLGLLCVCVCVLAPQG